MNDWPIGLSTGCFARSSIFDCLDAICAGGFHLVEVCSAPAHLNYHDLDALRRVADRLRSLGIEAYSFHAPFADHIDITSPDLAARHRSIQEVLTAAEAAATLGVRYFVIHPGPEHSPHPSGDERLRRLENVAKSLSDIATRCQQLGLMCVLENKLRHLLFGNIPEMMWILGAMSTTQVGVCLDTGHAHLAGDTHHAMHKLAGYLRMIHASDNFGRHDDHLPPGQGGIDWPSLLRHLRASGFSGSIILEIAQRGDIDATLESARRAARFLRDLAWKVRHESLQAHGR